MSEDKAYDMWKELEAAKAEIDRLRAENAELREALQEFDHYDLDEPILKIVEGLRVILAKTAKEGE